VVYALAGGDVAELLRCARRILTVLLADQQGLLEQLREADSRSAPEQQFGQTLTKLNQ
jgi:ArsR family transcriptional regulator